MPTFLSDPLPMWAVFIFACLIIGIPLGAGRKLRLLHQNDSGEMDSGTVGIVVASLLGLLAFLLAFTFGMAANRYEERRQAVLSEANTIGTAYLRADFLAEQQRFEVKRLLKQYVDIRSGVGTPSITASAVDSIIAQSEAIHQQLWNVAEAAVNDSPTPITGLFIQTINDLIDSHSNRVMIGMRSTIPIEIWIGLYTVAAIAMASAGFQWGGNERQSVYPVVALALTFAGVLTLVSDLDKPGRGFIRTDQAPMLDLARSLNAGLDRN